MSSQKCSICKRKLTLVEQTAGLCKCKQLFCAKHRCVREHFSPEDRCHPCSFDYLSEQQQLLAQQNPTIKADKIERMR